MALDTQTGGSHYKDFTIQPVEFIEKNGLGYCEGNVIKYVCRHDKKNGLEDINKAIHYLELIKELQYGIRTTKSDVQSKQPSDGKSRPKGVVCNCRSCLTETDSSSLAIWRFPYNGGY